MTIAVMMPGIKVTIAVGFISELRLLRAVVRDDGTTVETCDSEQHVPMVGLPIPAEMEGVRWCRGWSGPQVEALGTVATLQRADLRHSCGHLTPVLHVSTRTGMRTACSTCGVWLS